MNPEQEGKMKLKSENDLEDTIIGGRVTSSSTIDEVDDQEESTKVPKRGGENIRNSNRKKILVLDVNGIFFLKKPKGHRKIYSEAPENYHIISRKYYDIYFRPGTEEFLRWALRHFKVGIFTSTERQNISPFLGSISPEIKKRLLFIWTRGMCSLDPDQNRTYQTIKELDRIIKHPFINQSRKYQLEDILAIDDDHKKHLFNPEGTYLIVDPWEPGREDTFDSLKKKIISYT